MSPKKQDVFDSQDKVVMDIKQFITEHYDEIQQNYFNVIDEQYLPEKRVANDYIYDNISEYEYNNELLKVSVVILTANFFECEILNYNVYKDSKLKIKKLENGIKIFDHYDFRVVDAYVFEINQYTVLHLNAPETGSNTPCGSADLVRYVCNKRYLFPTCVISFGICYGIDYNKQLLGDTIVAEKIYPWSIGVKINDDDWEIKHDDYIIDLRLKDRDLYHKINDIKFGRINRCKSVEFGNVQIGNLLTSEAVVNNEKTKILAIEKAHGCKIIGGEMEGYGLAKECIYYGDIACLIVKAICDWGVCKNIDNVIGDDVPLRYKRDYKGQIQAYATYCAYKFLKKLFFENAFIDSSIFKIVKENIIDAYFIDGYIQFDFLKKKINDDLREIAGESNDFMLCDRILTLLESSNVMLKNENEGVVGYSFV